jgi:hypothetical protein
MDIVEEVNKALKEGLGVPSYLVEAADEIERLREALKRIAENNDGLDVWSFAEAALKGDE